MQPTKTDTKTAGLYAVEGRTYKIGLSSFAPEPILDITLGGLWRGLEELGFVKDSNLTVVPQCANGELANFHAIHTNLDNLDVDLILATSTPAISSAVTAVKNKPVVFTFTYTPLEAGAGKTYEDHLPFITGVGSFPPIEKTVTFIKDVFPSAIRVGTLYNSSEVNSRKVMEMAKRLMTDKGLTLVENTVVNSSEVYQAASALCQRNIDVMWITGDNTLLQAFDAVVKICRENNIPLIVNDNDFVKTGVLAGIGISWEATGYRTAPYVARVLNGESPAGIPIENYVEELVTINDDDVKRFGLTIPDRYRQQASVEQKAPTQSLAIANLKGKKLKLCLAHYSQSEIGEEAESGLRTELIHTGLIEGVDYSLTVFNASGDISTANSIAESIAAERWDLIFTASTPTLQIFIQKIKEMPIVFTNSGDPVGAGAGSSFTEHLPNVTGISTVSDFEGMIQLVSECLPGIKTIGTVYTPSEINSVFYMEGLGKAASKRGLTLVAAPANSVTEVADAALSLVSKGVGAFTQISDNLTSGCSSVIIKQADENNLPYFAFISSQVEKGAVAAIARDYQTAGSDAVKVAIQVLNGKSPKDIPFRLVSKSTITVNREVMNRLGINIPAKPAHTPHYTMTQLEIITTTNKQGVHLRCVGRLDANYTGQLNDVIDQLVRDGHYQISLDFSALEYLSSAGIRLLVSQYKVLQSVNGRFSLSAVSDPVEQILTMVGLSDLLAASPPQADSIAPKGPSSTETSLYNYRFNRTQFAQAGGVKAAFFGEPERILAADYGIEHLHNIQAQENTYSLGLGAIGETFDDCKSRFGEYLMIDGNAAYLPADGSRRPDYLINSGQLVANVAALYGLRFEGDFSTLIHFKSEQDTATLGLSQLIEGINQLVDSNEYLLISLAEISGLVGVSLNQSPVEGQHLFDFPDVKETLNFTTEPAYGRMLAISLGFVSRNPSEAIKRYTRPIAPDSNAYAHIHAAVFPYIPLKKTGINVHETIRSLFDSGTLAGLLHLVYDARDIAGLGDSQFIQGSCWIAPVTSLAFNTPN